MKKRINLTSDELAEIKGGLNQGLPSDVNNTNKIDDCSCSYNNYSVINNDNSVSGCSCQCV
ncbi:MAG: hypothetical protein MI739_03580 [Bacteroidales bacterium]|nr:hypothetical protein [Bacteroidales bacterium]